MKGPKQQKQSWAKRTKLEAPQILNSKYIIKVQQIKQHYTGIKTDTQTKETELRVKK